MEHENEHLDIREKLLRLPKLQADENFLKRLQIQIDILDSEERTRDVVVKGTASSYFKNLFGARLVPALGISSVVVAAFLVYFILADKKEAVVNNMTNNKTTETVITKENPGNAPTDNKNKEIAKSEDKASTEKNVVKDENKSGNTLTNRNTQTITTQTERDLSQQMDSRITTPSSKDEGGLILNGKTGRPNNQQSVVTGQETSVAKADDTKKTEDVSKITGPSKNETSNTEKSITSTEQEKSQDKSINEGGRGAPDAKKPQTSIKPKKKDINSNLEIDKSVLESLRNKLK